MTSVKRLWSLKGSIEKLNPQILERSGLLELFLSGISNSKFISSNEGRKCIACLFNFGPSVVQVMKRFMTTKLAFVTFSLFKHFYLYGRTSGIAENNKKVYSTCNNIRLRSAGRDLF
jgi:hypothetical protein